MRRPTLLDVVVAMAGAVAAFPGMDQTLADVEKRQGPLSTSLVGDLAELADKDLSTTVKAIKNILTGGEMGQDASETARSVPPKGSAACAKDKCCI